MDLVGEVAGAGEVHGHARGPGGGNDLAVADGATGLDDGAHPGVQQHLEAVGEREEGVGGGDRSPGPFLGHPGEDVTGLGPADGALGGGSGGVAGGA